MGSILLVNHTHPVKHLKKSTVFGNSTFKSWQNGTLIAKHIQSEFKNIEEPTCCNLKYWSYNTTTEARCASRPLASRSAEEHAQRKEYRCHAIGGGGRAPSSREELPRSVGQSRGACIEVPALHHDGRMDATSGLSVLYRRRLSILELNSWTTAPSAFSAPR